jgi:hypothetical protein
LTNVIVQKQHKCFGARWIVILVCVFCLQSFGQSDSSFRQISITKKGKVIVVPAGETIRLNCNSGLHTGELKGYDSGVITLYSPKLGWQYVPIQEAQYLKIKKNNFNTIAGGIIRIYSVVGIVGGTIFGVAGLPCTLGDADFCLGSPGAFVLVPLGLYGNRVGKRISGRKFWLDKWQVEEE